MRKSEKKLVDEIVFLADRTHYSRHHVVGECGALHKIWPNLTASELVVFAVECLDIQADQEKKERAARVGSDLKEYRAVNA